MAETDYRDLWYDVWVVAKARHGVPESSHSYDRDAHHAALRDTFRGFLISIYREKLQEEYQGLPLVDTDPLVVRVIQRHHWPIEAVTDLSEHDLMLALADELAHFKLPEMAVRCAYGQLRELPYPEGRGLLEPHRPEDMAELPS